MTTSLSDLARRRDELGRQRARAALRPMRASRAINVCLVLSNAYWCVVNAAAGQWIAILSAMCALALGYTIWWQTGKIRQRAMQMRPRPDYSAIARMERDVWVRRSSMREHWWLRRPASCLSAGLTAPRPGRCSAQCHPA